MRPLSILHLKLWISLPTNAANSVRKSSRSLETIIRTAQAGMEEIINPSYHRRPWQKELKLRNQPARSVVSPLSDLKLILGTMPAVGTSHHQHPYKHLYLLHYLPTQLVHHNLHHSQLLYHNPHHLHLLYHNPYHPQ